MADRLLGKRVLVTQARAHNYVENREYYPPELMQKDSFVASLGNVLLVFELDRSQSAAAAQPGHQEPAPAS